VGEAGGSTQSHAKTDDAIALPALSKPERYPDHNGRKGTAGGERELATANLERISLHLSMCPDSLTHAPISWSVGLIVSVQWLRSLLRTFENRPRWR